MARNQNDIAGIVQDFTTRLIAAVEAATTQRIQTAIAAALGGGVAPRRGPGRPPRNAGLTSIPMSAPARPRRKGPKQLCPVPGCKNPAAPVFGMVCAKHKDIPKAKIKEYREARRKAKDKGRDRKAA